VAKRRHNPKTPFGEAFAAAVKSAMTSSNDLQTQDAVAEKARVSQTTVSRLLRGEVDPQSETLRRVADALGINLAPLLEKAGRAPESLADQIARESIKRPRSVPLVSWVQAGTFAESIDTFQPGDAEVWLICPRKCGANTFALQVDGTSMEPVYQNGDIIFVDPNVEPTNGTDVVVRLEDRNEATFKRFVIEDGQSFLMPLNPTWQTQRIALPADARIAGVVIRSARIK
jgi:SOS-response transcriptional repressor LexA